MIPEFITDWLQSNPLNPTLAVAGGAFLAYLIARLFVARGLIYLTTRTRNQWDDILVKHLRPYRLAALAPLLILHYFSNVWPDSEPILSKGSLFLILWLSIFTINSLLNAVNLIYESRATYSGVAIQGYLDLVKILFVAIGLILSVALVTDESPVLLLSGLGALTAVLLLVFQDTILSLVASVQIAANDLVKEGDWIEVPSFNADGDVTNMSLHTIKIQNFDKTFTVIPTHKLMEVSYKNWRGMSQTGGRRVKRSLYIDIQTVRFGDHEVLEHLKQFDLLKDYVAQRSWGAEDATASGLPRSTNVGAFMAYVEAYLKNRPDVRKDLTVMVRQLDPGPTGLPLEIYVFTDTTVWEQYEAIQASIFDHLLAVVPEFGLRVFQQPTGRDFASAMTRI
ncbi:MAG: mechanosensitive ion channel domain-containing protein [Anaerolineales bacterium]